MRVIFSQADNGPGRPTRGENMVAKSKTRVVPMTQIMAVTPEIARQWLEQNRNNRPLNEAHVARLASKMVSDAWVFTHQGIAFDVSGRLVDGQHRLHAITRAGKSIMLPVTTGVPPESFQHIDVDGSSRRACDLLSIRRPDAKNVVVMAAIATAAMGGISRNRRNIGPREAAEFCDELFEDVRPAADLYLAAGRVLRQASIWGAVVAAYRQPGDDRFVGPHGGHDKGEVLRHAGRLSSESWDGPRDPMKVLHRRFVDETAKRASTGKVLRSTTQYALTVSGLRAALEGRELTRIEATSVDWS